MSSSFGNQNKKSENLENDTSFYTFIAGILLVFILYYFIVILKKIFYNIPFNDESQYLNCHCSICKNRYEEYKLTIKKKNINRKLFINILLFLFFLYLFIACCKSVQIKEIFDPYEILEISPTDPISKIKKSYKQLSLKYHPDKNKDDDSARERFMLINKAYRILTNEKAKENFKKYGNPDGPGILTIGLALPLFLFKGQVGFYILLIFAFLLVIIFPIMFIRWFKERNKYNNNGLILQNLPLYYKYLDNNTKITQLPFIIGMSFEFNKMDIEYNEENIKEIFNSFSKYFPSDYQNENISYSNMYAISVLYMHFLGNELIKKDNKGINDINKNKNKIIENDKDETAMTKINAELEILKKDLSKEVDDIIQNCYDNKISLVKEENISSNNNSNSNSNNNNNNNNSNNNTSFNNNKSDYNSKNTLNKSNSIQKLEIKNNSRKLNPVKNIGR